MTQETNESIAAPLPKAGLAGCLFLLLVLALLPLIHPEPSQVPSLANFAGRFHVVVLHFPIGLLALALVMEVSCWRGLARWLPISPAPVTTLVLALAAGSAFLAALFGWLLSLGGGYEAEMIKRHFYGGIASAAAAILALMFKVAADGRPDARSLKTVYLAMLLIGNAAIGVTGHWGGVITHGENYLTENAPDLIKRMLGIETRSQGESQQVFSGVILPILQERCVSCHNPQKVKGELRMDDYDLVMKGGQNGAIVVPGKPSESPLIKRVQLPLDDDDHMPPKGKPQPTEAEIAILTWWVTVGAPNQKQLSELSVPETVKLAITQSAKPKH